VFAWRETVGEVGFAVTDRAGGAGAPPYDALNLAGHVGDDPSVVARNRALVAGALGVAPDRLVTATQVHGRDVVVVDGPLVGPPPTADALVTRTPGLVLAALVADCTPVLLADPEAGVVGVAHAGRPGLVAGIVPAVLDVMRAQGARRLVARVGPSVCGRCYEVPAAMRDEVAGVAPEARARSWTGTPALDVAAGVVAQLADEVADLQWLHGCTREDDRWFSYRRAGTTGRFAGLAWLAP
jgi:YfiH family protein